MALAVLGVRGGLLGAPPLLAVRTPAPARLRIQLLAEVRSVPNCTQQTEQIRRCYPLYLSIIYALAFYLPLSMCASGFRSIQMVQDSTEAAARQSFPLLGMDRNGEQWSSCRCIQWIRLLVSKASVLLSHNGGWRCKPLFHQPSGAVEYPMK